MKTRALLLIAHGSRHDEANSDLMHVADQLRLRGHSITIASYLELAPPDIVTAGHWCVAQGADLVVLVPYFLSAGTHVQNDLTNARRQLSDKYPMVEFTLAEPLGRHPLLIDVVEERAMDS